MRILIVEDNDDLAFGLRRTLEGEGYDVDVADDGPGGVRRALELRPDLVILDLTLPGLDGFGVLKSMRDGGLGMPVLILTARGEEAEKVRGFRLGADDYVTKPFGLLELLARVNAHLRRARTPAAADGDGAAGEPAPAAARSSGRGAALPPVVTFGDVRVEPLTHTVSRAGRPVALRPKEFDLLIALIRRQGRVATRLELLREVWEYDHSVISRTVDTHVAELRRKLEDDPATPRHILTVRKTGYRLAGVA